MIVTFFGNITNSSARWTLNRTNLHNKENTYYHDSKQSCFNECKSKVHISCQARELFLSLVYYLKKIKALPKICGGVALPFFLFVSFVCHWMHRGGSTC